MASDKSEFALSAIRGVLLFDKHDFGFFLFLDDEASEKDAFPLLPASRKSDRRLFLVDSDRAESVLKFRYAEVFVAQR